VTFPVKLLPIL